MNPEVKAIFSELMEFLDRQAEQIREITGLLTEFRAALIRRDQKTLHSLHPRLEEETLRRFSLDENQRFLRERMAGICGKKAEAVCLTDFGRILDSDCRGQLTDRQALLGQQVVRLQEEHLATELLLRECARMNRRLLEAILGACEQSKIYDAHGRSRWNAPAGLMSVQL